MTHLYGGKDQPELKIIDAFVCHLRKKLAQVTDGKHYIETLRGRGYRLRAPAEMPAPPPSLTERSLLRRTRPQPAVSESATRPASSVTR